ncbi:MAG: hypothetical protein ABI451_09140 [Dokdonella sp.]
MKPLPMVVAGVVLVSAVVLFLYDRSDGNESTNPKAAASNASAPAAGVATSPATPAIAKPFQSSAIPVAPPPTSANTGSDAENMPDHSVIQPQAPASTGTSAFDRELHRQVSEKLADEYIVNMYSEEKMKEPVPEMAAVMHAQVDGETSEPGWGPPVEQELRNYLNAGLADLGSQIDITHLVCRYATCEIIGVIQSRDQNTVDMAQDRWNLLANQMRDRPWWVQYGLGQQYSEIARGPNDSTMLFLFLLRQHHER